MANNCPATVRGKHYPSIKQAAEANGRTERQAHRHLAKYGHLDYLGKELSWRRPDMHKPVKVAHLEFESISAAAQELGVDRKTIRNANKTPATKAYLMRAVMRYMREKETQQ